MVTIGVLGGGISGLSSAYYLLCNSLPGTINKIILLEAGQRLGGWVQTSRFEDGTLFEHGPRTMRIAPTVGANSLELVESLGLAEKVLPVDKNHVAHKNRYIYVNKELHRLPNSIGGILRKQSPFGSSLFSQAWKEPFLPKGKEDDESIYDFSMRRLSPEITKYAMDPLLRGIFAGNISKLSMQSCFPPLYKFEKEHGSIVKGMLSPKLKQAESKSKLVQRMKDAKVRVWSLEKGLQQLTDTLAEFIEEHPAVDIHRNSPCTALEFSDNKITMKSDTGDVVVDHLVSSIYSKGLASILPKKHQSFAKDLAGIEAPTVAVVNLQYEGNVLPCVGFGHLVPSCEPSKVLGVIYDSCVFPEHGSRERTTTRLTCMMGGDWFEELFGNPDHANSQHMAKIAMETVEEQLGIKGQPIRTISKIHRNCIPQYFVGHAARLERMEKYVAENNLPMSLIGSSYRGASVNDCIYNARLNAEAIVRDFNLG